MKQVMLDTKCSNQLQPLREAPWDLIREVRAEYSNLRGQSICSGAPKDSIEVANKYNVPYAPTHEGHLDSETKLCQSGFI